MTLRNGKMRFSNTTNASKTLTAYAVPFGGSAGSANAFMTAESLAANTHVDVDIPMLAAGDYLVVAINDDRSARRLRGPGRPLTPARDRARLVAALEGVDAVVVFGGRDVGRLLRRLRPEVHCKGTDYRRDTVPERDVVLGYGGAIRIVGDRKRHATTDMIRRIARRLS